MRFADEAGGAIGSALVQLRRPSRAALDAQEFMVGACRRYFSLVLRALFTEIGAEMETKWYLRLGISRENVCDCKANTFALDMCRLSDVWVVLM